MTMFSNNINNNEVEGYNKAKFLTDIQDDSVEKVDIYQNEEVPTGEVSVTFEDESVARFYVSDVNEIEELAISEGLTPIMHDVSSVSWISYVLTTIIIFTIMFFVISYITSRAASGGANNNKVMNFGKSKAKMTTEKDKKVTFKDVAGLDEEKEELSEIVDFLRTPNRYIQVGARIPKGVLLEGPPGTGKTQIGRAHV